MKKNASSLHWEIQFCSIIEHRQMQRMEFFIIKMSKLNLQVETIIRKIHNAIRTSYHLKEGCVGPDDESGSIWANHGPVFCSKSLSHCIVARGVDPREESSINAFRQTCCSFLQDVSLALQVIGLTLVAKFVYGRPPILYVSECNKQL